MLCFKVYLSIFFYDKCEEGIEKHHYSHFMDK